MAQGANSARQEAARRQASTGRSTHDAILEITRSGAISSCNPAATRVFDYPAEQLIGSPAEMLVPPGLRPEEDAVLRRILAGEEVLPYRAGRVCRNGTVIEMYVTISPIIDAAGEIVGAVSMARRASLQDARDRFEARVEKQRADAGDAADRFEVRVQQEREEMRDAAERFERRVAMERVQAREAEDRFHAGIEADRARAQRDQDLLRSQLQQSQRLEVLDQLAEGVTHDFNNLLAVILNYAAFVAEELATRPESYPESTGHDVGQIQLAAERATALTHQLLAFAHREVVRPRVLDLDQVVTNVAQLLGRTLGEDIVLHTQRAEGLWPVLADPRQIEHVLANLAVNARDAMSSGGTLTIDTANITVDVDHVFGGSLIRAGRYVRLRVNDTGIGMSADVAEHAFEPFYTTKSDGTGTGLGLATVYGILAQANASVGIESQPGTGTTVTILFPVTDEVAVPAQENPSGHRTPKGEMILLVEDNEALRDLTERIFIRGGYRVLKAADGREAIALATEYDGEIPLLVTDVVMPQMLGKEAAEKIREIRPDIEVLYMSGYAQPVLAAQGRLDGDVDLVQKPFSAKSIIERAGQLLNRHPTETDP